MYPIAGMILQAFRREVPLELLVAVAMVVEPVEQAKSSLGADQDRLPQLD
jgi:hypothetical protein